VLETRIVQHGAPTLAGLKTGSLLSVDVYGTEEMERDVARVNQTLKPKGVRLTIMKYGHCRVLLYLYREERLAQCLACPTAAGLLDQCGYQKLTVCDALDTLRERLAAQNGFPHEIGLFLGYPLSDVAGFMRHRGKDCLLCGCWKVYGEKAKAVRMFAQYRKCADIYSRLFHKGYSLINLTVAVKTA
jgi:hypothetical protein